MNDPSYIVAAISLEVEEAPREGINRTSNYPLLYNGTISMEKLGYSVEAKKYPEADFRQILEIIGKREDNM